MNRFVVLGKLSRDAVSNILSSSCLAFGIKTEEDGSGSQVLKNQDSYSAEIKLTKMFS